jgi:hypothetical protein
MPSKIPDISLIAIFFAFGFKIHRVSSKMAIKDDPKQATGIPTQDNPLLDSLEAQRAKYGKLIDLNGDEFLLPTYTIKDVYDAIPKHCFERNVWKSLSYVVQDVVGAALTFYVFHKFVTTESVPYYPLRFGLW